MNILSLEFFALVAVCRFAAMRLTVHARNILLLVTSLGFCLLHSPQTAMVLLWTFLVTDSAFRLYRGCKKRWVLWAGSLVIVVTWVLSRVFQSSTETPHLTGVAAGFALGLSFYMLQALAFLWSLGHRKVEPDPTRVQLLLYLSYFPKLAAGPIEPPDKFLRQLRHRLSPSTADTVEGIQLVVLGIFRKAVIGDPLIHAVPRAFFTNPQLLSTTQMIAWLAALLFGIYNDFMGYTQIARGVSRILGITLSRNFRYPFFSRSVSDAWTRWHITLSQWFREFLFFPVSRFLARRFPGTRHILPMLIPPIVVMLLSGLWHGFQIHFLAWGLLLGLMIFGERVIHVIRTPRPADQVPLPLKWAKGVGLWCCLGFSLVPFCMNSRSTLHFFDILFQGRIFPFPTTPILLMIPVSLILDHFQQRYGETFDHLPISALSQVFLRSFLILAAFMFLLTSHPVPFIYQGF